MMIKNMDTTKQVRRVYFAVGFGLAAGWYIGKNISSLINGYTNGFLRITLNQLLENNKTEKQANAYNNCNGENSNENEK